MGNGGLPVVAFGACGSTICTSAAHGTTRSICSRNSRLLVFFVDRFRPNPSCFMASMCDSEDISSHARFGRVLQTIPKYVGRGYTHLTGRGNYTAAANALQLDLVAHPELAEQPANAIRIAVWFWKTNGCGAPAVRGDIEAVTLIINGGLNGLIERRRLYVLYSRRLADEQALYGRQRDWSVELTPHNDHWW